MKASEKNSRRLDLDVKGDPFAAPQPNVNYPNLSKEENFEYYDRAIEIAKQIIK